MDFEPLFKEVEAAIGSHEKLVLAVKPMGEPEFRVSRFGWSVRVRAKVKGSHKKPTWIQGDGDTPEEAKNKLIEGLDLWAKVI